MVEVGILEAEARLSELLDRVEAEETVIITRHGKRVARFVCEPEIRAQQIRATIEQMLRERQARATVSADKILAMRDEVRRFP